MKGTKKKNMHHLCKNNSFFTSLRIYTFNLSKN